MQSNGIVFCSRYFNIDAKPWLKKKDILVISLTRQILVCLELNKGGGGGVGEAL